MPEPKMRRPACFGWVMGADRSTPTSIYAQTWDRCRRLIGALRDLGLAPGDRVGVCQLDVATYDSGPGSSNNIRPPQRGDRCCHRASSCTAVRRGRGRKWEGPPLGANLATRRDATSGDPDMGRDAATRTRPTADPLSAPARLSLLHEGCDSSW